MRNLLLLACLSVCLTGNADAARKIKKSAPVPAFSAQSFVVADNSGQILKEQDGESVRPIASITKLMVGLLASEQDQNEQLDIPRTRLVQSSIPKNTNTMTRKELLTLALVRSDNFAAQVLCNNIENCVEKMNQRAAEIGMSNTNFNEPTGLDRGNVSTAHDLLKLMVAVSTNAILSDLSRMPSAEINAQGRTIKVRNTNPLTSKLDIVMSKTGFTNPAGGCLVMMMNSEVGQRIFILLGSRNAKTRIPDMERLVRDL